MSDVSPIRTGTPVGTGSRGLVPTYRPEPRTVNFGVLGAHETAAIERLREAEDAVVELREREAKRATLYAGDPEGLKEKYGITR